MLAGDDTMRPVPIRKRAPQPEQDSWQDVATNWSGPLPYESAKAFAAFCFFRDLGTSRSLTHVAKHLNPGRPITVQSVSEWAIKHCWKQRCWAYDYHCQEEARREVAAARREARERQCRLAVALQKIAMAGMAELLEKIKAGVELHMSPDEIASMARTGQELERFGLGEELDRNVAPKISVFMGGEEVENIPELEPPEKKPN
jgi:hypothetical protein